MRRTGCRREHGLDGIAGVVLFVKVALDLRANMHDLGIPVYHHVIGDSDRADLGNSTEVIAAQIDQHVMLGKLLLIGKQLVFERLVLLRRFAARTGAGNREGGQGGRYPAGQAFPERNT